VDEVLVEDRPDGVRILRLNRPERLNALTPDMIDGLTAAMDGPPGCRARVSTSPARTSGSAAEATPTPS
jgi:enoyl-CoA hydratase